jgi:hypothetical protein
MLRKGVASFPGESSCQALTFLKTRCPALCSIRPRVRNCSTKQFTKSSSQHAHWLETVTQTHSSCHTFHTLGAGTEPWMLEPTARYSQEVARAAREAGRDVRLAQPKKAQRFLLKRAKRAKPGSDRQTGSDRHTGCARFGAVWSVL